MIEYHKIQTLFKRALDKPSKPMIEGDWTTEDLAYLAENEWEFTEKVDGTNIRIGSIPSSYEISWDIQIGGRTENAMIPAKLLEWIRHNMNLRHESLQQDAPVILFGEGYGPGIQSGGLYSGEQKFVLFDVKVGDWWLKRDAVEDVANDVGVEYAPLIGRGTLHDAIDMVKSGLKSEWGNFEAEGIVARPAVQMFNRKGERIITKIKGRDFKQTS